MNYLTIIFLFCLFILLFVLKATKIKFRSFIHNGYKYFHMKKYRSYWIDPNIKSPSYKIGNLFKITHSLPKLISNLSLGRSNRDLFANLQMSVRL